MNLHLHILPRHANAAVTTGVRTKPPPPVNRRVRGYSETELEYLHSIKLNTSSPNVSATTFIWHLQ